MQVLIMPNLSKELALEHTLEVISTLNEYGASVFMSEHYQSVFCDSGVGFAPYEQLLETSDLLIVIGGDGTIIHSAKYVVDFVGKNMPKIKCYLP